jgi:hypothetical protein
MSFVGDFHPAQPFPYEKKDRAAEGGHAGIERTDDGETPTDQTPEGVANPESQPGQDDIEKQFLQTTPFPKMKGSTVGGGKDDSEDKGGKSHH